MMVTNLFRVFKVNNMNLRCNMDICWMKFKKGQAYRNMRQNREQPKDISLELYLEKWKREIWCLSKSPTLPKWEKSPQTRKDHIGCVISLLMECRSWKRSIGRHSLVVGIRLILGTIIVDWSCSLFIFCFHIFVSAFFLSHVCRHKTIWFVVSWQSTLKFNKSTRVALISLARERFFHEAP